MSLHLRITIDRTRLSCPNMMALDSSRDKLESFVPHLPLSTPSRKMTETRGTFIVIEGLDRSGKSTQAEILRKRLEMEERIGAGKVKLLKFPGILSRQLLQAVFQKVMCTLR